jgi:imidazolonepropionase-like amidohydrolase
MSEQVRILFRHAAVLDAERGELVPDRSVLVAGDTIAEVGGHQISASGARVIDVRGMTLMPGLIDAHVHVTAVTADLSAMAEWSPTYVTARAGRVLAGMLERGFTTVRDVGGADYGLAAAVDEGYLDGPRIIFGGKALSQTGGHGDWRGPGRTVVSRCSCCPSLSVICDGVDEVRRAARDEIRRGAHHIKIMLSGGIASPTDRVDAAQFSLDEIRAAVEEAEAANLYVAGHAYTARAINRGLQCGVRSIEHGNLLDETSISLFRATGAFYVPTLATYSALAARGRDFGLPEHSHRKVFDVLDHGLRALEMAQRAGIPTVYGTDLLGGMHEDQSTEFRLRAEVQPAADIIRSATVTAARMLRMDGQLGIVAPHAVADLLVVAGDP